MSKLTRTGARRLTAMLDQVASVVQQNPEILGVNPKIAKDFAYRCDLLSDAVETRAVSNFPKSAAFDASTIGEEVPGPIEQLDSDEPWMDDHFTQERFEELRGAQQAGALGAKPYFAPNAKKAAMDRVASARNPEELFKAARALYAALDTLPGISKMQMEAQVDALLEIEKEIVKIQAEYDAVFKKLAGLEKDQKAGLAILKKAADQVDAKGKTIVETRNGIIEFVAKINTSTPGIEQLLMNPADAKKPGERAGDLLGRLLEQVDAEVAAKCIEIIQQTKKDLTYSTQITQGLKVVAKTASVPSSLAKQAGIAEIAVSIKDWLAGQASEISKKITGIVGDVTFFFKTCLERTKIVQKAGDDVQTLLSDASSNVDKMLASGGKTASRSSRWLTEE